MKFLVKPVQINVSDYCYCGDNCATDCGIVYN
jgi:Cys-rich peptide (Clo7bot family)